LGMGAVGAGSRFLALLGMGRQKSKCNGKDNCKGKGNCRFLRDDKEKCNGKGNSQCRFFAALRMER
jgi:hypothetical protein